MIVWNADVGLPIFVSRLHPFRYAVCLAVALGHCWPYCILIFWLITYIMADPSVLNSRRTDLRILNSEKNNLEVLSFQQSAWAQFLDRLNQQGHRGRFRDHQSPWSQVDRFSKSGNQIRHIIAIAPKGPYIYSGDLTWHAGRQHSEKSTLKNPWKRSAPCSMMTASLMLKGSSSKPYL